MSGFALYWTVENNRTVRVAHRWRIIRELEIDFHSWEQLNVDGDPLETIWCDGRARSRTLVRVG